MAATNSRGVALGQAAVNAGDENAAARDLITRLGRQALARTVITADAKHTSTAFIIETEAAGVFWLFAKRPATRQRLTTLPWHHAQADADDRNWGHRRAETRSLKILALDNGLRPDLMHAWQAIRLRRRRRPTGKPASIEVVYYLTTLPPADTTPATWRNSSADTGASRAESLWSGTSPSTRTTTARTGNAPGKLPLLRNTAITLHRQNGSTNIQPALRAGNRRSERLLHLLPEIA